MKNLYKLIGRIGFSAVIAAFGIMKFVNANTIKMKAMVPEWLPFDPVFWLYLTGAIMIVTAALIIWDKKYPTIAALVLAGTIATFVLFIHLPGAIDGKDTAIYDMLHAIGFIAAALLCASMASD